MRRSSSTNSAASRSACPPETGIRSTLLLNSIFADWFGHDVARGGGQPGALELHGAMLDLKVFREFLSNGGDDFFALIHVHVRDASVAAEGIVRAAERPDVDVVHFVHIFDGEYGARHLFHAGALGAALQQDVRGIPQNSN